MKPTRILSPREVRQLTRVHARIGALLALNGTAAAPRRPPGTKPKRGPAGAR